MNLLLPFLAVIFGFFAAIFIKKPTRDRVKLLLAFSGAFLLSAVVSEFLPEVFASGEHSYGAYLMAGVFLQIILEFFSKGAEHGHLHTDKKMPHFPMLLFISLCIHAFLEGMPLDHHSSMVYGIAVHKLPIAFIFSSFLLSSNYGTIKSFLIIVLFGAMSPLGSLAGFHFEFLQQEMIPIKAVVAGIILHVSTTLILEASEAHKFNMTKIIVMLLGAVIGYFI